MKTLDEYKEKIANMKQNYQDNTIASKPETYSSEITNLIDEYSKSLIKELYILQAKEPELTQDDIRVKLQDSYKKSPFQSNTAAASYRDILSKSSKAKNIIDSLTDIKKQQGIMDWKEKGRALLLRILTAIGIATVVLLTSYIAKELEIPLPLRMGLTG